MSQILFDYPSVPSNFKNLIVVPDVGFISTPEKSHNYKKGEKILRRTYLRFNLNKPFIMGKHQRNKEKERTTEIEPGATYTPIVMSEATDMTMNRGCPQFTWINTTRCEEVYKNYEKFVNTNRDILVATVVHSDVTAIFGFARHMNRFEPRIKLTVKDLELLSVTNTYKQGFNKDKPLVTSETRTKVETSKENFEIKFNFPFCNIFWRDDYYLRIYSSGLLEFIPVKYNFTLYIKGEYSVLKEQKLDDDLFVSPT